MATKPTREMIRKHAERALENRAIYPPDPQSPSFEPKMRGYEEELERQLTNSELFLTRAYEREQVREDDIADRAAAAREDLEATLMRQYQEAGPGVSDDEARAALPDLLHRHRLANLDQDAAVRAQARRRVGI